MNITNYIFNINSSQDLVIKNETDKQEIIIKGDDDKKEIIIKNDDSSIEPNEEQLNEISNESSDLSDSEDICNYDECCQSESSDDTYYDSITELNYKFADIIKKLTNYKSYFQDVLQYIQIYYDYLETVINDEYNCEKYDYQGISEQYSQYFDQTIKQIINTLDYNDKYDNQSGDKEETFNYKPFVIKYLKQLIQLRELGYDDIKENIYLLEDTYNGNVNAIVEHFQTGHL
jgi:hypothetical protein